MSKYYDLDNTAEDINAILSNLIDVVVEDNNETILGIKSEDDETKIVAKDYSYVGEINGNKYQFVSCDGDQWIEPAYWGYKTIGSTMSSSGDSIHTEYRLGPIFSTDVTPFGTTYTSTAAVITNNLDIAEENGTYLTRSSIDAADENYYKLKIMDASKASFSGASKASFSGASRFIIADDAKFDITNSASYSRSNPQIYIHDDVQVNLDSGNGDYSSQYGGGVFSKAAFESSLTGVRLTMHDLANLQMDGRSYLLMHDSGTLAIEGNSLIKLSEYSQLFMDDSSYFSMNCDFTSAATNYGPTFCLGGGCGIIMNGYNNDDTASSTDLSGTFPLLLMSANEFIYSGDGICAHTNSSSSPGNISTSGLSSALSDVSLITYKPQIRIGGSSTISMDTATNGKNHVKIGACEEGLVEVQLLDDTHIEMRQNSILSLRGDSQGRYPWKDFEYDSPSTGAADGGGSMLTMYDQSILNLRGLYSNSNISSLSSTDELPTSGSSYYPVYQIDDKYYIAGTIEKSEDETYNYSDWEFWSPSRERISGSPLIEAIGDAEVRFLDYSSINMSDSSLINMNDSNIEISNGTNTLKFLLDENGITFTDNNGTVTFTTTELEALKNLL